MGSSPTGHPTKKSAALQRTFSFKCPVGREQGGLAAGEVSDQPSGLSLSPRVPICRNVYCGSSVGCPVGLEPTCRNVYRGNSVGCPVGREQQRSRPPPAAETGRRGWGSALIFQGPAKGLRKNQQAQLVGRFPPPLYKQLQNIQNQTKAAAQNTLPCSVLRPFSVFSASQLLQDILDLFVGVALLQQLAPDGRIAPALTIEACGAVGHDRAAQS